MPVAKRRATYADLEAVPDTKVAELIEGDLIVSPRPASPHARAATSMGTALYASFDGPPGANRPGGWWLLFEPELHFGRNVLVPDMAGWRQIVDPITRTTEVYRLEDGRWVVVNAYGGSDPIQAEPFQALALEPARWWLDIEPYST